MGVGNSCFIGDAAVDGDEQCYLIGKGAIDGGDMQSVALGEAVGLVEFDGCSEGLEEMVAQGARGGAIDIVVAVDADGLALCDGLEDAFGGLV